MIEKNLEIEGCNGRKISIDYRCKEVSEPLIPIIYVHGFKGFKDWASSNAVADAFAEKGFFYLKFNFSHNGVTAEDPIDFVDLEAFGNNNYSIEFQELGLVIDWLEKSDLNIQFSKLAIIGHSRGGGITLLRTAQDIRIQKAITWASVSDFEKHFPVDVSEWKEKGVQHILNGRTMQVMPLYYQLYQTFQEHRNELDIPKHCANIQQDVLIVHGTNDPVVSLEEAEQIHSLVKNSTLLKINDAGHTFGAVHPAKDLLSEHLIEVIDVCIDFLNNN